MNKKKVKLTAAEKSELIFEGVVTVILLLLINMSLIVLINLLISSNPDLSNIIWIAKNTLVIMDGMHLYSWQNVFMIFMGLIDVAVVYWRLIRRYRQMQMRHVITELHYIAEGNFDHRINFYVNTDLQKVIDSINSLVDSTVQAMQEERQIEQSKDELVTNVSHDIRTPLTSIIGYLGLLRSGNVKSDQDAKKYIEIAYIKAQQMKSLADDLFEYTTVRQQGTKLNLSEVPVNSMLEQVAAGFELEAERKGISLNVETTPPDLTMAVDPEKMSRVFNNLISNALKYGKDATEINLIASQVDAKTVKIKIENNGAQIPDAALKRVFERFYRVETSRSTETGGTGLGLAITKWIVQMHQGQIAVHSDKKSTYFLITLPKQPEIPTHEENE